MTGLFSPIYLLEIPNPIICPMRVLFVLEM